MSYICDCGVELKSSKGKSKHFKTKFHIDFINNQNQPIIETNDEPILSDAYESDSETTIDKEDDNFLDELDYEKFVKNKELQIQQEEYNKYLLEQEKEQIKQAKINEKENLKLQKIIERESKKKKTKVEPIEDDDIFSDKPTEILGQEKTMLLNKIKQYKVLFNKELKTFKIKKNPSIKDLNDAIEEIDIILNGSTINDFMMDSIFQCIKIIEGVSSRTKNYNISGLSLLLKNNAEFNSLCKQLYIKYGVFNKIEPEYKILMIVAVSSGICIQKNKNFEQMNSFLEEEIEI